MSDVKKLEEILARRQKLQIEHAKLSAEVEAARKEYETLKTEAEKEFGTSKIAELESKLVSIREANSAALKAAEDEVIAAEAGIARFKVEFSGAQNANF